MSYAMLLLPEHLGRSLVVAVALVAVYAVARELALMLRGVRWPEDREREEAQAWDADSRSVHQEMHHPEKADAPVDLAGPARRRQPLNTNTYTNGTTNGATPRRGAHVQYVRRNGGAQS
jgi:hypothetical protein